MPINFTEAEILAVVKERLVNRTDTLFGVIQKGTNYLSSLDEDKKITTLKALYESRDFNEFRAAICECENWLTRIDTVVNEIVAEVGPKH